MYRGEINAGKFSEKGKIGKERKAEGHTRKGVSFQQ